MGAASGRKFVPLAACLAALTAMPFVGPSVAGAQRDPSAVVTRVHAEGGYPSDIVVLDDETDDTTLTGDDPSAGAGAGPNGTVTPDGERDGGDPDHSLDLPLPQFVRDLLTALGRLLGAAASPLAYLCFALGVAMVVVLVVYLVARLRLPRRDLARERRPRPGGGHETAVDPLLEQALETPEEYARQGKFREAIHALFVRALGDTARRGDVDRRGRTAREVVAAIGRAEPTPPDLDALLGLTELVWFGGRPATEAQYVSAIALANGVRGALHSAPSDGGGTERAP